MYRKKTCKLAFLLLILAASCNVIAEAQTDVALNIYGAFSNTAGANNVDETAVSQSGSAGGMVELGRFRSALVGYEGTYSFNRANQTYIAICTFCYPIAISADAHEVTGDWLISDPTGNIRPFALGGVGVLVEVPTGGQSDTKAAATAVYVYGAGIDWGFSPHLGLRVQYRGNIHKASYLFTGSAPTEPFMHTAEPMIGVYYKF